MRLPQMPMQEVLIEVAKQTPFAYFLRILASAQTMVCAFVVASVIFLTSFALAKSPISTNPLSTNIDSSPKPFSLDSYGADSLIITPDSRLKSHNRLSPFSQNPSQDFARNPVIINPNKALQRHNQANAELLNYGVIPQFLPRGKIPSPLLPPIPLTPYSLQEEPLEKVEFIISYKALSQNGVITGEKYSISSPLISKSTLPIEYTCSIDTPINDLVSDDEIYAIKYILSHSQDEVLHCLRKGGANILSHARTADSTHISDDTILSVPAKRVLAYFDNRYLILEVLKELK